MSQAAMRASGLVLRLGQLGESDVLADIFTRELGRVTALAKGGKRSRRRFFGLLLNAHYLDTELGPSKKGGGLRMLTEAALMKSHLGLRLDHRRWMAAGPVLELLLRATAPLDSNPQALELSLATLARLEQARETQEMASALIVHLARLLSVMGYGLRLDSCLRCGLPATEEPEPRLSLAGGFICRNCKGGRGEAPVPPGLVKALYAASNLELAHLARLSLPSSSLAAGFGFLGRFWQETTTHDLPSIGLAARILTKPKTGGGKA